MDLGIRLDQEHFVAGEKLCRDVPRPSFRRASGHDRVLGGEFIHHRAPRRSQNLFATSSRDVRAELNHEFALQGVLPVWFVHGPALRVRGQGDSRISGLSS